MKALLLPIILLSSLSHAADQITGTWSWDKNNDQNSFTVNIEKMGAAYQGKYCAVASGGMKIDCGMESDLPFPLIKISESSYELEFNDYFSGNEGKASISVVNGSLVWRLLSAPKGENYIPEEAKLIASSK